MSLETWKEEFYPVEASTVPEHEAIAHSLRKWIGMRPENLKKHGVLMAYNIVTDGLAGTEVLHIGSDSCALCEWYYQHECPDCPLHLVRGNVRCDDEREDESESPWEQRTRSVEPMIHWLERAKEEEYGK